MREIKFRVHGATTGKILAYEHFNTGLNWGYYMPCSHVFQTSHNPLGRLRRVLYTGLRDKNGKEIYEGDILLVQLQDYGCPKVELFQVLWDDSNVRYKLIDKNGDSWGFDNSSPMEVIGNIYENKELLEV